MRLSVHHEGADYDNAEEVIVTDEKAGRQLRLVPTSDGFRWEIMGDDIDGTRWGIIPNGDDQ